MTYIEYANKLGISLNSAQIEILNLIEEQGNENLIISFPRISGRQMLYNLIERKKGYEQGRADALNIDMEKPMHFTTEQKAWVKNYVMQNAKSVRADERKRIIKELESLRDIKWQDTDSELRIVKANAWDMIETINRAIEIARGGED